MAHLAQKAFAFNFLLPAKFNSLKSYTKKEVRETVKALEYNCQFVEGYLDGDCTCIVRKDKKCQFVEDYVDGSEGDSGKKPVVNDGGILNDQSWKN